MNEPRTWVDIEGALREWARDYVDAVDRRVFFGPNNAAALPQIVLYRIAGPDDAALIQFEAWGDGKATAAAVAAELSTAIDAMSRYIHEGVLLHGARVDSIRWWPDEQGGDTNKPGNGARYIVEATVMATASGPVVAS